MSKMLDQLDLIDARHGRMEVQNDNKEDAMRAVSTLLKYIEGNDNEKDW